jgi:hypothetical protein
VKDRTMRDHTPYVATPVGPFRPDETDAIERARVFMREAYRTEDVRQVEPAREVHDFDTARGMVIQAVQRETRHEIEFTRKAAECSYFCRADADQVDLDTILDILGVDPEDV